ncbi:MAG: hypothetical protein IJ676_02045, partial [Clostridia bacterium]|nr:hypothetical protein [Clostridia bacterium]
TKTFVFVVTAHSLRSLGLAKPNLRYASVLFPQKIKLFFGDPVRLAAAVPVGHDSLSLIYVVILFSPYLRETKTFVFVVGAHFRLTIFALERIIYQIIPRFGR